MPNPAALRFTVAGSAALLSLATVGTLSAPAADAAPTGQVKVYASCTALNRDYPHGVARKGARDKVSGKAKPVTTFTVNDAVYNANRKSDRDKDGIACEKR